MGVVPTIEWVMVWPIVMCVYVMLCGPISVILYACVNARACVCVVCKSLPITMCVHP